MGQTNVYRNSNFLVPVICRDWKAGICPRGSRCRFLHNNEPSQAELHFSETGAEVAESSAGLVGPKNRRGGASQKNRYGKEQAERETQVQAKRKAEAVRIEAEVREREERSAREKAERTAQEEARRREEAARIEAERRENEARLAREREVQQQARRREAVRIKAERQANEARLARERGAQEQARRREEAARIAAEIQANELRLAREREAQEQLRRREEAVRIWAERQANEARLAQEREAQEEARRREVAARIEAERRANEARLAREQAKRIAEERQRLAREKAARAELLRIERARKAEEERKRKEAEKLAKEKAAEEARQRRQVQLEAQREREAAVVEQYVVLDSSLVTCGAGLNIRHVVTGFDLCKITIKNIPRDAKRAEIADIFLHQGVEPSEFFIFQMKQDPREHLVEAVILANAEHGQAIALGLEGIEFRNQILSFSVSDNASGNAMDAATRNSPFLLVSWRAPSEKVIATYSSMAEAQENARKLNLATWGGRQISATMNERPQGVAGLRYFVPSSVKIMGLPLGVPLDADFVEFTGTWNLRMLKSISFDFPGSFQTIRQHLANSPGVRMNTYETLSSGQQASGEAKVKVQFDEWEDAKNAHALIVQMQLGANSPRFKAWLPPKPLRYTIKIPRQQYDAQKRQWDALSEKKPGSDAYVQPKIGDRGDVVFVQVLGQDKKAAGPLKVRVESMVAGEKLDTAYWHSSFGFPDGRAFFNRIYHERKVFVRNDFKTRSLKAYGEPEAILEVREMIKGEVDRLAQRETTRTLDQRCIGFFVREGLGKLTELLGEGNVNLNLASRPCKITVKGGEEATHHLMRLIDESRSANSLGGLLPGPVEKEACPICTDEASNPEQLGCGHTYCAGCLKHFLTSAADTKNFPLLCMGNDATCNVPIAIPFIRRFLPLPIFQGLVEAAFSSYLDQHPQELKYCTTPDCKQMYRHRTDPAILQCPSCFSTVCAACDEEAHEGMTCQERRLHHNPAEQERLNDELAAANGYKKCPRCKIWIEKNEGCNHMSCKCGAHICWVCMGIFEYPNIYDHMRTIHGGIGLNDEMPADIGIGNVGNHAFMAGQADELDRLERQRQAAARLAVEGLRYFYREPNNEQGRIEERRREAENARRVEELRRIAEQRRLEEERVWAYRRQAEEQRNAERRRLEEERMLTNRRRMAEAEQQRLAWRGQVEEARRLRLRQDEDRLAAHNREEAARKRRQQEEEGGGWCLVM